MKEKIANTFRLVVLALLLSTAIGYSLADWAPPTGAPPFNNTPPPINVGAATQEKVGNLFLDNWLVAKKARTQSTIGVAGCIPSSSSDPTCDSEKTLTTKDYVDGIAGGLGVWQNVPLTDTEPFDIECEYRLKPNLTEPQWIYPPIIMSQFITINIAGEDNVFARFGKGIGYGVYATHKHLITWGDGDYDYGCAELSLSDCGRGTGVANVTKMQKRCSS
jgi:hypothetical protein